MVCHFYLSWIFLGLVAGFFYNKVHKTNALLLVPLYFGLFLVFSALFLMGLSIIVYAQFLR